MRYHGLSPIRCAGANAAQENDGRVVAREIDADILLCDPAKEPIPGSYSYRLIVNAIEEGSLDTQEDYLCPSIPTSLSTTKSAPKTKQTRNKFTQEEDRLLIRWVNKQASKGMPISGNEIYKDFVTKVRFSASYTSTTSDLCAKAPKPCKPYLAVVARPVDEKAKRSSPRNTVGHG